MIAVIRPIGFVERQSGAGLGSVAALDDVAKLAEDFSPRVECGPSGVALDASGLSRLFGSPEGLAWELTRQAATRGLHVTVAIAATRSAAAIWAHAAKFIPVEYSRLETTGNIQPGRISRVIPPGHEAAALAPLPLEALLSIADLIGPALERAAASAPKRRRKGQGRHYRLAPSPNQQINKSTDQQIDRLRRWGLRTLGDLAALPASDLAARLGDAGLVLQRAARGEDERPLVPASAPVSFLQSMRLEWPVDDLQPLAFIVSGLCESLEQALAAADRGAISLTTMLRLVTKEAYARTLTLPSPMRDARVLRTLVMLDLESHPPQAAVDEVVIDVDVAPGRILQSGLFEPALPEPETLSTLVARLSAVVGESRVGAPALVETHRPGAIAMAAFAPHAARHQARPETRGQRPEARAARDNARAAFKESPAAVVPPGSGLRPLASGLWPEGSGLWPDHEPAVIRRCRPPRPARVKCGAGGPVHVAAGDISGEVVTAAGPWRTSGGWWDAAWDHDEWDVALDTGIVCRLAQDRRTRTWMLEGVLD